MAESLSRETRALYRYTFPDRQRAAMGGVSSFALVELTGQEELSATEVAGGVATKLAYALAMASLREVDGRPVATGDGSADHAFLSGTAKFRSAVLQAYASIHSLDEREARGFLASCEVVAG